MSFAELELSETLLRAVREAEYEVATPIQTAAIPPLLAGRDLVGCAQTGTGKTAAFALPTLQRLATQGSAPRERGRKVRCLVLAPTRELASQIGDSFRTYGRYTGLRHTVIFGGVGQNPQVRALQHGVDILVATPGRLLDLMNQGICEPRSRRDSDSRRGRSDARHGFHP
jgi:ATP-dependent RNA helicase RhlE